MSKKLAGTLFIRNGESLDYCYKEAIQCLLECTDHVFIVDAGSDDGTYDKILELQTEKITVIHCVGIWEEHTGKEKLSHFTNIAIEAAEKAGYEYVFNLQGDEILHEKSYPELRKAIATNFDGYLMTRVNLWASPYLQLNVPHERKPCSTEIVRLAKSCYRAYDDAESINAPAADSYFLNGLRIYHMGFVRKREIHPTKIRTMQADIFQVGVDPKLEGMEIFDPYQWFSKNDLIPIDEPLPKIIQNWAAERYYGD